MARKPNYNFERMERDRAKAKKSIAKAQAKSDEKLRAERVGQDPVPGSDDVVPPEADPVA